MPEALNATLAREAPAAFLSLSALGRKLKFPTGIPAQAAEARGCEIRATIGQLTDAQGHAIPVPALDRLLNDVDPDDAFLYSTPAGNPALRDAWRARISCDHVSGDYSRPIVTLGLTHGLSICADLFADESTDLVLPAPHWGNYNLIFGTRRGARVREWAFFGPDGGINVEGLREVLETVGERAIVVMNFPSNPCGVSPTPAEAERLMDILRAHPRRLVVIFDDAYHGMVFEPHVIKRSLFWDLVNDHDPERMLPVKVDGCTKELLFFGGRVGFLTFGVNPAAADVLEDKVKAAVRGTVNVPPGPSQGMALAALRNPDLDAQIAALVARLRVRYDALTEALNALDHPKLHVYPFNAGFFALVGLDPSLDVHQVRRTLITEQSVGVIAVPAINALRIAFCSIGHEQIPELVRRLEAAVS